MKEVKIVLFICTVLNLYFSFRIGPRKDVKGWIQIRIELRNAKHLQSSALTSFLPIPIN
jgi:hypothetical protein